MKLFLWSIKSMKSLKYCCDLAEDSTAEWLVRCSIMQRDSGLNPQTFMFMAILWYAYVIYVNSNYVNHPLLVGSGTFHHVYKMQRDSGLNPQTFMFMAILWYAYVIYVNSNYVNHPLLVGSGTFHHVYKMQRDSG
ncbi:unnamed protein product, partial [Larinioides sclopetarius]